MSDWNERCNRTARPRLTVELPMELSDDAALYMAQFLQHLADCFEYQHHRQLVRAFRARMLECEERCGQQADVAIDLGLLDRDEDEGDEKSGSPPF